MLASKVKEATLSLKVKVRGLKITLKLFDKKWSFLFKIWVMLTGAFRTLVKEDKKRKF
jgi:hypothetical protein